VSDVVQGYATLASSLLERWNDLASSAATKVDAGEYDCVSAAQDLTTGASIATEGGLQWASETLEAVAALSGCKGGPNIVTSEPFSAPAGATLELEGPLTKGPTLDQLPVNVVRIEPGPNAGEFTLTADATGHRGATYVGRVKASTQTTPITVWIAVP
jgi:hypothetical protein